MSSVNFEGIADSLRNRPAVKSLNFEFLRANAPISPTLRASRNSTCTPDPASALIRLRLGVEMIVNDLYAEGGLSRPFEADLFSLLDGQPFRDSVPGVVLAKLHVVRKLGNMAAHGGAITFDMARRALEEMHQLACWLHLAVDGGAKSEYPAFNLPAAGGLPAISSAQLKNEKKVALEKLAAQEARMEQLLAELEQARRQASADFHSRYILTERAGYKVGQRPGRGARQGPGSLVGGRSEAGRRFGRPTKIQVQSSRRTMKLTIP